MNKDYMAVITRFDDLIVFDFLGKDMTIQSAEDFWTVIKKVITIRKI